MFEQRLGGGVQTDRTSEWEGKWESGWQQQGEVWGGGVTYPSCVILAAVFISAAIFCSLTFDSETTPIPPLLRGNEVEKEKEGGGEGRRSLVNGGKYGRSLPPSLPAGRLFLGQGCTQEQQGFSPHSHQQAERWRAGGGRESSSGGARPSCRMLSALFPHPWRVTQTPPTPVFLSSCV